MAPPNNSPIGLQAGPCLIDVSRLASRLPRAALTGVDRVERAYLRFMLNQDWPLWGLVRSKLGYLLLDRAGLGAFLDLCDGTRSMGPADRLSRAIYMGQPDRARVDSTLRRLSCARAPRSRLVAMLRRHVPTGAAYLNTGHSNLTERSLSGCKAAGLRVAVLIHDTLPLDHPEFMRADTIPRFHKRIRAVSRHADLVLHPTKASQTCAEAQFSKLGRVPSGLHAPIGIDSVPPDADAIPERLRTLPSLFLTVGTIEPRKNHALLLDIWSALATELPPADLPYLVIAGARGWHPAAFFDRLGAHPLYNTHILEAPGLSDSAIAALYQRANALLFPSFAEGTGLPPLEAAAQKCPVILADLAVYRETLGSLPVYLSPVDMYPWLQIIKKNLAGSWPNAPVSDFVAPDWQSHFAIVFPDG